jgi:hypothetical protein
LVFSRLGHSLSRLVSKPSVAGDSLMERMRSTTFALLGLTTAVGLGLVAFISYQGWSGVLTSPIPGLPVERQAVHDGTVAARPDIASTGDVAVHAATVAARLTKSGAPAAEPAALGLAGSHRVVAPPASQPGSGGGQPSGQGGAGTAPTTQSPSPVPAPAPAPTAPATTTSPPPPPASDSRSVKSHGEGKVHGRDEGFSSSKSTAHHSESHAHPAPTEPPVPVAGGDSGQAEPAPSAQDKSGDSAHGNGHAYGHYGR